VRGDRGSLIDPARTLALLGRPRVDQMLNAGVDELHRADAVP
jgi:hypothetical protein